MRIVKCRHFTSIADSNCKAGVIYRQVRDSESRPFKWPCFQEDGCSERCASVSYYTPEEIQQQEAESQAVVAAYLENLRNNICPECKQPLTYKRQVGRCVYGSCGHRLYQGRLTEEERKQQPKVTMPTLRAFWEMPQEQQRQLTEQVALLGDDSWAWDEIEAEESEGGR